MKFIVEGETVGENNIIMFWLKEGTTLLYLFKTRRGRKDSCHV
jgi:hypothetical protein